MLNIIVPLASNTLSGEDPPARYPVPLIEINRKSLIEYVMENLNTISGEKRFIFIVLESDCSKYHIDNTLRLLGQNVTIVKLKKVTSGAVCSVLMAIDEIDKDEELIVVNSNQIIDCNYNDILNTFRAADSDGGVMSEYLKREYSKRQRRIRSAIMQ
jgi:NDP-sugar pyrophosphorylase family protein